MTTLGIISGLTAAVIAATVMGKLCPKIPLPIWMIGAGVVLWIIPFTFNFVFQPETFLICVIAPLLFGEAQRVSRKELWELRSPILLLALGLVLVTVFAGGYFIYRLIPGMGWAGAFALAAIISPTDLIAVQSMTKGMRLPGNMTSILEGESLLNDAAGVVSFKMAVAAALTGTFSVQDAVNNFLITSLGGILGGLILGFLFVKLRLFLQENGLEELPMVVVIQLVTPLCIFYVTEALGVSGILAVIAAGIIHGIERERLGRTSTKLRMVTDNSWLVLEYLLNGIVFVLLGYLLPSVFGTLRSAPEGTGARVVLILIAISGVLLGVRFLWVWIWHRRFVTRKRGALERLVSVQMGLKQEQQPADGGISRSRYALIAALCGVHGTFTLATALSIPYILNDGSPFPMRDLILVAASGVVLISMVIAAITLPRLLEGEPEALGLSAVEANKRILQEAIRALDREGEQPAYLVAHYLNGQLADLEKGGGRPNRKVVRSLVRSGNRAAMLEMGKRIRDGEVSEQLEEAMFRFRQDSRPLARPKAWRRWISLTRLIRIFHLHGAKSAMEAGANLRSVLAGNAGLLEELHQLRKDASQSSIACIKGQMNSENRREALIAIQYYSVALNWTDLVLEKDEEFRERLNGYRKEAFQIQRDGIRQLRDEGAITEQTAKELQESLLYEEMLEINS